MVRVTAANVGEARANADADEQGTNRTTVEVSSKAQATGISTGDGINQITNRGTIVVSAAPRAVLEALSDSGFIDSKNYNSRFTDTDLPPKNWSRCYVRIGEENLLKEAG